MGRSVLVTGGNRGIGLAIARALAGGRRQRRGHLPLGRAAGGPARRPLRRHRHRVGRRRLHRGRGGARAGRGPRGQRRRHPRPADPADDRRGLRLRRRHQPGRRSCAGRQARVQGHAAAAARPGRLHLLASSACSARAGQATTPPRKAGLVGIARSLARELGSPRHHLQRRRAGLRRDRHDRRRCPRTCRRRYAGADPAGPVRRGRRGRAASSASSPATTPAYITGAVSRSTAGSAWATDRPARLDHRDTVLTTDREAHMGLLDGKTLLVTGVLMDSSIAFHVARLAQEEGAEVVLTSFGRHDEDHPGDRHAAADAAAGHRARREQAPRTSTRSPTGSASTSTGSTACCTRSASRPRRPRRQLPQRPSGTTSPPRCSLRVLAQGARGRGRAADARRRLGRRARLRRDRSPGPSTTGWASRRRPSSRPRATSPATSGPRASASTSSRRARSGRRPPSRSRASRQFEDVWARAGRRSAGTSRTPSRPRGPASRCSRTGSRATTGEIVHVDGGFHAMG